MMYVLEGYRGRPIAWSHTWSVKDVDNPAVYSVRRCSDGCVMCYRGQPWWRTWKRGDRQLTKGVKLGWIREAVEKWQGTTETTRTS